MQLVLDVSVDAVHAELFLFIFAVEASEVVVRQAA